MTAKISAVVIARNEEKNIGKCIKCLNFANEVIVIDNDSTDRTAELARNLSAKVYSAKGLDFSSLRNSGREKANGHWLLYVDADELVTEELAREITTAVRKQNDIAAYAIPRKNYYLGYPWPKSESQIRLIRKENLINWQGQIHETPKILGQVSRLHHPLLHFTHRNLSDMVEKTNQWSAVEASLRFKSKHPQVTWWRFIRVMWSAFYKSYIGQRGFKAGVIGLIESIYQAFSMFITYAKLWEMQTNQIGKQYE